MASHEAAALEEARAVSRQLRASRTDGGRLNRAGAAGAVSLVAGLLGRIVDILEDTDRGEAGPQSSGRAGTPEVPDWWWRKVSRRHRQ